MRDSFVFYKSFYDSVLELENSDSRMKVMSAICDYAFEDIEPDLSVFNTSEKIILTIGIPLINASIRNFENGKKGGRPTIKNPQLEKDILEDRLNGLSAAESATKHNVSERTVKYILASAKNCAKSAKTTDTLTDTSTSTSTSTSTVTSTLTDTKNLNNNNNIPSLSEIESFCTANSLIVAPQEFYDYYNEHGWEPVYNWKSLLKKWNKNQIERQKSKDSSDPYAGLR
jgi:hypothetical protein